MDLGPGMFDEDAAALLDMAVASKPKTLEDLVGPWGGYGTSRKKASKIKSTLTWPTHWLLRPLQPPVFLAWLTWSSWNASRLSVWPDACSRPDQTTVQQK